MGNTSDVLEWVRSMNLGHVDPELAGVLKAMADQITELLHNVDELHRRVINVEAGGSDPPSMGRETA